jgi:hypothetical protein
MMSMVEREPVPTMPFEPRGLYRSEIGSELTFNLPNYQLRRGDTEEEGGVAIFWNKYWILQLKAKNEEGLPVETKNYRMEFSEILEENRLIRSLHLSPGKLGITGMETGVEPLFILNRSNSYRGSLKGENRPRPQRRNSPILGL